MSRADRNSGIKYRPTNITADREKRVVVIDWNDGHQSRYSFAGLRKICPCVECRGGHAYMGGEPDPLDVRNAEDSSLNLDNVEIVGGYALKFSWSDGHATGIYTWELLRAVCPCETCV